MNKVFFTADQHFFHANIIKYCNRPYGSVEEMNRDYIAKWNSVVTNNDIVYHLGDFAWIKGDTVARCREIFEKLNGKSIVITSGNHDKSKKLNSIRLKAEWEQAMVVHYKNFTCKHRVTEEDYLKKRKVLCGHVHEKWQRIDDIINVGVDVWDGYPKTFDELLFESKQAGRFYDCSKCKERLEIIKDNEHYKKCIVLQK